MTNEELLIPRWKVISDFPFNKYYPVGKIIIDNGKDAAKIENGHDVFACDWNEFPHIFKKLQWYEERKIEDLPKYVINKTAIPKVIIPVAWVLEEDTHNFKYEKQLFAVCNGRYYPFGLMPATEKEYNEFVLSGSV